MTDMNAQFATDWRIDLKAPLVMGLALLLLAQLLLALGLGMAGGRALTASHLNTPLFDLSPDDAQDIRILSGDGSASVHLKRTDGGWVLADLADAPAQSFKVDQLLGNLSELKRPLPLGTTEAARQRFRVADDAYERRLSVSGETGTLVDLLVGHSPGFRRVFARPMADAGVYDVRMSPADLSARHEDWVELGLLRLERDRIRRITSADWTLARSDEAAWTLQGQDHPLDMEAVEGLVLRLANLSYRGILGSNDDPSYHQAEPARDIEIGLEDGSTLTYRISRLGDGPDWVLKDASKPWYFRLTDLDLGELLDARAEDLTDTRALDAESTDMAERPVAPIRGSTAPAPNAPSALLDDVSDAPPDAPNESRVNPLSEDGADGG